MTQSEFDSKMSLIEEKEQAAIKPLAREKGTMEETLYDLKKKKLEIETEINRIGFEIHLVSRSIMETRLRYRAKRNEIKREFNENKEMDF